VVKNNQE